MSSLEHELLEKIAHLNAEQKRKVLEFVDNLEVSAVAPRYSARELLRLPSEERARLVLAAIELSAGEDFETFEAYSEESLDGSP